ncbi:hypothetical protein [Spirosoma validum]|uniref:Uncharacterized protein n=1 Tax=Spirosoma validum TaxID=2771355 RepID=A0A927GFB1_9BACT|nr:hypothetical protein [Spirosoma validum]MBD2755649.1 hypothetical protein [Spirosoma validum]
MAVFFIATIVISIVGGMSYFTSAWFGCQSSGTGLLPPHYRKLMDRFEKKKEIERLNSSAKPRIKSYSDETVK